MEYISTRGCSPALNFEEVTLQGLAPDGGLYVPQTWPHLAYEDIAKLAGLPYPDLAARIMQPFVGECLSPGQLLALADEAYASFAHPAVTPLSQLDPQHWLLDLTRGPTLAFKDVALQLLGGLFDTFLTRRERHLTIIGATSGDTGAAAIDAVAGREHIDVFMLHPAERISDVQRRQMTTVLAPNVHNIAVQGSFDDAQAMVKRMFSDPALTSTLMLGAVNSINWARLLAQAVYYFAAALQLGAPHRKLAFSVPTGNFGNVFAGYAAARMGLPISKLIVATNENDVLHRAIADGDYVRGEVVTTSSPSMDIQVSSNFERLLFEASDRNPVLNRGQMDVFTQTGSLRLTEVQRDQLAPLFTSCSVTEADAAAAMCWAWEQAGCLVDPHTAIALHAARAQDCPRGVPLVTLATAHPAKFRSAVERATGTRPGLPPRLGDLFRREERFVTLPNDYEAVASYVAAHGRPAF
jgi:threonine synthase